MDKMTLEDYIVNPLGKNNAVMSKALRETLKKQYDMKFHNLLLRENGKIDYTIYKISKQNIYYYHIKVPSETVPDFYYDVVFKFYADENIKENARNLEKYYVKFYSNDPAFVYTYAYVFRKNGMFIDELAGKMSKQAMKDKPKEKNPDQLRGYVKTIYFAYIFMKERGLLTKVRADAGIEFNGPTLLLSVQDADSKISERQIKGAKISKRKKIMVDKTTLRNIKRITNSNTVQDRLVTTTSTIPKISSIKKTPKMGRTVKTVKKK